MHRSDCSTTSQIHRRFPRRKSRLFSRRPGHLGRQWVVGWGLVWAMLAMAAADATPARASAVDVQVRVANPTMMANQKQTNYLRITLTGFEPPQVAVAPPVNVAIVIDNSGSMRGEKITQARRAALTAVDQLRDDDIVSVVLYNSSVHVLVPATKARDRESIKTQIRSIEAGGSTALFAGVSKGADEVRKFLSEESVNRIVLLSDGQANIGPSSPRELSRLGRSLVKENISVSTLGLGLGYNEDLMSGLAAAGSGNHLFVERSQDLVAVFDDEFKELMSVVANDFKIHVQVGTGVRPVRVLGTQADIVGQDLYLPLAQLYSRQERYFVVEVEVDEAEVNSESELASVDIQYRDVIRDVTDQFRTTASVSFTDSEDRVVEDRDYETYAFCNVQIANEENVRATALRDAGQVDEAEAILLRCASDLEEVALQCSENNELGVLPEIEKNIVYNRSSAELIKERDWTKNRKVLRSKQNEVGQQQRAYEPVNQEFRSGR